MSPNCILFKHHDKMTNLYSQQNNQRGKLFQDVNHYELLNDVYFYEINIYVDAI